MTNEQDLIDALVTLRLAVARALQDLLSNKDTRSVAAIDAARKFLEGQNVVLPASHLPHAIRQGAPSLGDLPFEEDFE